MDCSWKSLRTIYSQMIPSEKSTQNEVALFMTDNSVEIKHDTSVTVLLLSEGSDKSCLCGLDRSIWCTQTSTTLGNINQLKCMRYVSYSLKLSNLSKHRFQGAIYPKEMQLVFHFQHEFKILRMQNAYWAYISIKFILLSSVKPSV